MSPIQTAIFDRMRQGPATSLDLMYAIWGTKEGPKFPYNGLRCHIADLNLVIGPRGLRITKKHSGRGGQDTTPYVMVRIEPTATMYKARHRYVNYNYGRKIDPETRRLSRVRKIDPAAVWPA